MKLALCQMACSVSMEENVQKSVAAIEEAARSGADLVLFPEVHLSPFFPQVSGQDATQYGVAINDQIIAAFQAACRKHHIMAIPNVYLLENGRYFDASILIGSDGVILGVQKMVHIASAPHFYEQEYYTPSDDGFAVFETPLGNIGMVICFDRHYPESIRTEALLGADLICIPTVNEKAEPSQLFQWEIRVSAFQNSVPIAMCNRVGTEGEMTFSGESLVVDGDGNCLLLGDDREGILYCDVDCSKRAPRYHHLRRPEYYW